MAISNPGTAGVMVAVTLPVPGDIVMLTVGGVKLITRMVGAGP